MVQAKKIILPGEAITTEEEYVPGQNTFSDKGIVKAATIGYAEFDGTNKEVRVRGNSIKEIQTGDVVTGKVTFVKESTVVIELVSAENGKRILGMKTAQLPVRNVSTEYITELRKFFKVGDVIRARIMMSSPLAIDVATNEKGLGVIIAYCSNCRKEMQFSNGRMLCANCGSIEDRKWFEAEQKPREFTPREGGFGGDRRGGFRGGGDRRGTFRSAGGFGGRHSGGFGGRDRPRHGGAGGFNRGPRRDSFGGNSSYGGSEGRQDRTPRGEGFGENRSFNRERSFNGGNRPQRRF
jgi:exosome complex component CSL4